MCGFIAQLTVLLDVFVGTQWHLQEFCRKHHLSQYSPRQMFSLFFVWCFLSSLTELKEKGTLASQSTFSQVFAWMHLMLETL